MRNKVKKKRSRLTKLQALDMSHTVNDLQAEVLAYSKSSLQMKCDLEQKSAEINRLKTIITQQKMESIHPNAYCTDRVHQQSSRTSPSSSMNTNSMTAQLKLGKLKRQNMEQRPFIQRTRNPINVNQPKSTVNRKVTIKSNEDKAISTNESSSDLSESRMSHHSKIEEQMEQIRMAQQAVNTMNHELSDKSIRIQQLEKEQILQKKATKSLKSELAIAQRQIKELQKTNSNSNSDDGNMMKHCYSPSVSSDVGFEEKLEMNIVDQRPKKQKQNSAMILMKPTPIISTLSDIGSSIPTLDMSTCSKSLVLDQDDEDTEEVEHDDDEAVQEMLRKLRTGRGDRKQRTQRIPNEKELESSQSRKVGEVRQLSRSKGTPVHKGERSVRSHASKQGCGRGESRDVEMSVMRERMCALQRELERVKSAKTFVHSEELQVLQGGGVMIEPPHAENGGVQALINRLNGEFTQGMVKYQSRRGGRYNDTASISTYSNSKMQSPNTNRWNSKFRPRTRLNASTKVAEPDLPEAERGEDSDRTKEEKPMKSLKDKIKEYDSQQLMEWIRAYRNERHPLAKTLRDHKLFIERHELTGEELATWTPRDLADCLKVPPSDIQFKSIVARFQNDEYYRA